MWFVLLPARAKEIGGIYRQGAIRSGWNQVEDCRIAFPETHNNKWFMRNSSCLWFMDNAVSLALWP